MKGLWYFYNPYEERVYTYEVQSGQPGDPTVSGNVNVTENRLCFGQIQGDPDIAGWGVFGGLVLNAAVSVIVAFFYMWIPFARAKWKQVGSSSVQDYDQQNTDRTNGPAPQPNVELTPVDKFMLTLVDTNLVSALAIIISSLVKLVLNPHYPLYHVFIARSLAALALVGHNAASFVYSKLRDHHRYSLYVRWIVSILTTALYLSWSVYALGRFKSWEQSEWPCFTPTCFSAHLNRVPWTFTFWIKINLFWIPQGFAWTLLNPFKFESVDSTLESVDNSTFGCIKDLCTEYWKIKQLVPDDMPRQPLWRGIFIVSWNIIKATAKSVIVILWLSFSALFFATDALTPFANIGFDLLWATYDILTVKFSNIHVVVDALDTPVRPPASNPELRFGIGQIFPFVMGLQLVMAGLDALADHFNEKQEPKPAAGHVAQQIPVQTLRQASRAAAVQGVDTSRQMDPAHVRLRRVETTNEM